MTHDVNDEYKSLWDKMWDSDLGKKVWTFDNKNHIYRKVFRVYNQAQNNFNFQNGKYSLI